MLNIGGDKNDESYRYKMPAMTTQIVGRGNGIKTALLNIGEVAKALHVPPAYIIKFLAFELGTRASFEKDERGLINGPHTAPDLQKILDKFIDLFVLCPQCKLPELNMSVRSSGNIRIDCAACGKNANIKNGHKLCQFIVNNPPPKTTASGAHKNAEQEKAKRDQIAAEQANGADLPAPSAVVSGKGKKGKAELSWHTDTSDEAKKARRLQELGEVDVEHEARQKRIQAIKDDAQARGIENSPATMLRIFIAQSDRDTNSIYGELKRLQLSRTLDDVQLLQLVLDVFINEPTAKASLALLKKKEISSLLTRILHDDISLQVTFINCLVQYTHVTHPDWVALFPLFLSELYQHDILESDSILQWHSLPPESSWFLKLDDAKNSRTKAQPVVDFLADEDEDDDEDDETAE